MIRDEMISTLEEANAFCMGLIKGTPPELLPTYIDCELGDIDLIQSYLQKVLDALKAGE